MAFRIYIYFYILINFNVFLLYLHYLLFYRFILYLNLLYSPRHNIIEKLFNNLFYTILFLNDIFKWIDSELTRKLIRIYS